jgi:hypothetical protein
VNLYADPDTFLSDNTNNPILYADCEGLRGDNKGPDGKDHLLSLHKIEWDKKTGTGEPMKRKDVVETLFPRILYAFSDVVVYVGFNKRQVARHSTTICVCAWGQAVQMY